MSILLHLDVGYCYWPLVFRLPLAVLPSTKTTEVRQESSSVIIASPVTSSASSASFLGLRLVNLLRALILASNSRYLEGRDTRCYYDARRSDFLDVDFGRLSLERVEVLLSARIDTQSG